VDAITVIAASVVAAGRVVATHWHCEFTLVNVHVTMPAGVSGAGAVTLVVVVKVHADCVILAWIGGALVSRPLTFFALVADLTMALPVKGVPF